jgi:DNA-binding CsgD family transcriptional regulator
MRDLILLYYGFCYSIGGAGLVLALIAARLLGGEADRRFASIEAGLALVLVPFFALSYFQSRPGAPEAVKLAIWGLSYAGESLLIALLPRFIHSFFDIKGGAAILRAWTAAAGASFACIPLVLAWTKASPLLHLQMALLPAAMVYVTATSLARGIARDQWKAGLGEAEKARWRSFSIVVLALTAVFLPIMLLVDFFPGALVGLGISLSVDVKAFPLFYAALSAAYGAFTLPALGSRRRSDDSRGGRAPGPARAAEAGLSQRELEVAGLLLSGLRYREIGERLYISLSTVKTHVERIYRKTGARNKIELGRKLGE